MTILPNSVVTRWSNQLTGGKWCPESIDVNCPHCSRLTNLKLEKLAYDVHRETIASSTRCSGCSEYSSIWVIKPGDGSDPAAKACDEIAIYPNSPASRKAIIEKGHLPEEALERAYYSAIKAYNVGLWDACATSCRKTLEGIAHTLDGKGSGPLFSRLNQIFEKIDLTQPLIQVADSLRKGGNMGAHFNLEKEPNREVASAMLDLLDFFLDYIFVLKERANSLEKLVDGIKTQ